MILEKLVSAETSQQIDVQPLIEAVVLSAVENYKNSRTDCIK